MLEKGVSFVLAAFQNMGSKLAILNHFQSSKYSIQKMLLFERSINPKSNLFASNQLILPVVIILIFDKKSKQPAL